MKKILLGSLAVTVISAGVYHHGSLTSKATYSPRVLVVENEEEEGRNISGAMEYYFMLRKNPVTNSIDFTDVQGALGDLSQRASFKASSSLGLTWSDLGPSNVGGRTRALWISKTNNNYMIAGGVSGGLFVSMNGGQTWNKHSQPLENAAVTCITEAANGDIYFGTGEGLYSPTGIGAMGVIGGGVWKSTDGGNSFSRLATTIPVANNAGVDWACINQITAHPTNASRVYAATNRGTWMTDDGGSTWSKVTAIGTLSSHDVEVAPDGSQVIISANGRLYKSSDGSGNTNTFAVITNTAVVGIPNAASNRIEVAFAPSDANYIYACASRSTTNRTEGVYLSIDKGVTWTKIGNGGSLSFDPLGSGAQGQGEYNNAVAVSPQDKGLVFVGGVGLWKWQNINSNYPFAGQWDEIAYTFETTGTTSMGLYVHADKHVIKFNPGNPNILYVGGDGGIFRSINNGSTFYAMNNGFNITQAYSIGFEHNNPYGTGVFIGTQDNGSQYISGTYNGSTTKAREITGGDGGDVEMSFLNEDVFFSTIYYGQLFRTFDKGITYDDFYSDRLRNAVGSVGASFVTPIALYENANDLKSSDSLLFIAKEDNVIIGIGTGTTTVYSGTLTPTQASSIIVPDSLYIVASTASGVLRLDDDNAGNLSGGGTGSINYATRVYSFTFNAAPTNGAPVQINFDQQYNAGAVVRLKSKVTNYPFSQTLPAALNAGDTVKLQDVVQARFALGLYKGQVWVTKTALNQGATPEWFQLTALGATENVETLTWSPDGDHLYIGTSAGNIWRTSNISKITDTLSGDAGIANNPEVQTSTKIGAFSRVITDIAVDPNNSDRIVVTLGGYGVTNNVYFCGNATTAPTANNSSNFVSKTGSSTSTKLPAMPVYSAVILKDQPNTVLVGTEYGVFANSDITQTGTSITWTEENSGINDRVPTFRIRQQSRPWWNVNNSGVLYIGTHGRGAWKCTNYYTPTSVKENYGNLFNKTQNKSSLAIYPNPVSFEATLGFNVFSSEELTINVFDLQGKLARRVNIGKVAEGKQEILLNVSGLTKGTYLVNVEGDKLNITSRMVVVE